MSTTEDARSDSFSLWGIRRSIWGVICILVGAGFGSVFDRCVSIKDTGFGLSVGLMVGSTALAVLEYKTRKGSRVPIVLCATAVVWMVGLKIVEGS